MNEVSIFWLFAPILLCAVITVIGIIFDPVQDRREPND